MATQYSKKQFAWMLSLQEKQTSMLKGKDCVLDELYNLCDNDEQRDLIKDLLIRFNCFTEEVYNLALIEISNYIKNLGYDLNKTALVAFCHDHSADSSQEMLQALKVKFGYDYDSTIDSNSSITTINRFGKIIKYYQSGIRHFIAIDEFTGSGQTIINCHNEFLRAKLSGATINYCLVAGMETAIQNAINHGADLYVAYRMKKGISDYYSGEQLIKQKKAMQILEDKLAERINTLELGKHHMGFNQSESLYSKLYGNIPNNVFPIMWWKAYKNGLSRKTLFNRVQDGY